MNSDSVYIMLLCFVSGIAQCALMGCGIYMLKHHCNYQFQKVFAVTLLLHSIGFFNNFWWWRAAICHVPISLIHFFCFSIM